MSKIINNQKGFSITEVLIASVILASMAFIIASSVTNIKRINNLTLDSSGCTGDVNSIIAAFKQGNNNASIDNYYDLPNPIPALSSSLPPGPEHWERYQNSKTTWAGMSIMPANNGPISFSGSYPTNLNNWVLVNNSTNWAAILYESNSAICNVQPDQSGLKITSQLGPWANLLKSQLPVSSNNPDIFLKIQRQPDGQNPDCEGAGVSGGTKPRPMNLGDAAPPVNSFLITVTEKYIENGNQRTCQAQTLVKPDAQLSAPKFVPPTIPNCLKVDDNVTVCNPTASEISVIDQNNLRIRLCYSKTVAIADRKPTQVYVSTDKRGVVFGCKYGNDPNDNYYDCQNMPTPVDFGISFSRVSIPNHNGQTNGVVKLSAAADPNAALAPGATYKVGIQAFDTGLNFKKLPVPTPTPNPPTAGTPEPFSEGLKLVVKENCGAPPPAPICGNGIFESGEQCDDGNITNGDGCSSTCMIEAVTPPRCGDGTQNQASEECDDGNLLDGDGCDHLCRIESCGNGRVELGEQCDDGNSIDNDLCNNLCEKVNPAGLTCVRDTSNTVPNFNYRNLDILLVADTSGSMYDNNEALGDGIEGFLSSLPAIPAGDSHSFKIAVLPAHGKPWDAAQDYVGKIYKNVQETRTWDQSLAASGIIKDYLKEISGFDLGAYAEMGLYSVYQAVSQNLASNQSKGFFRNDAGLAVIFIADENDGCFPDPSDPTGSSGDELFPYQGRAPLYTSDSNPEYGMCIKTFGGNPFFNRITDYIYNDGYKNYYAPRAPAEVYNKLKQMWPAHSRGFPNPLFTIGIHNLDIDSDYFGWGYIQFQELSHPGNSDGYLIDLNANNSCPRNDARCEGKFYRDRLIRIGKKIRKHFNDKWVYNVPPTPTALNGDPVVKIPGRPDLDVTFDPATRKLTIHNLAPEDAGKQIKIKFCYNTP